MNTVSLSIEGLPAEAEHLLDVLHAQGERVGYRKAVVLGLSGDLGSGKTTFSQHVARILGVTEQVTSPTFVIEKIYKTKDIGKFETLIHIDAYRIEAASEIDTLGFKDVLNSSNTLILIEWPEKIETSLPQETMRAKFVFIDEKTREISYEAFTDTIRTTKPNA